MRPLLAVCLISATAVAAPSKLKDGDPRLDRLATQKWKGHSEASFPLRDGTYLNVVTETTLDLTRDGDRLSGTETDAYTFEGKTYRGTFKVTGALIRAQNAMQFSTELVSAETIRHPELSWTQGCNEIYLVFYEDQNAKGGYILRGFSNCNQHRTELELTTKMN